jgi:putative phosphoesterase
MRLAVISDIHGNYAALDAVLSDIARRGVDATLNLGDVLAGPFDPIAVADRVRGEAHATVRGNHDRWIVEGRDTDWKVDAWVRETIAPGHLDWLAELPATQVVDGDVFMCHATPQDDTSFWMDRPTDDRGVIGMPRGSIEERAAGLDYPVLLCGHTHVPRTLRLADGRLLVNPGSVGLPFLLGSPDARYAIIERSGGRWSVNLLALPYDPAPAMEQARALGHPGFAEALQTGWARLADL